MTHDEIPSINFSNFLGSFAATGVAALQDVESAIATSADSKADSGDESENPAKRISRGLITLQHLIDTLAMLEAKTAGNLSDDEQRILQTTLTELRFGFVRLRDQDKGF